MTTKTLKGFFEDYSTNPELHEKVWKMGGVRWSEYKQDPEYFYDASSGAVTGCIYYDDTVKFAKRNLGLILEQLRETEQETGSLNVPRREDDETKYYNWLTWFAWEQMASELQSYLDC